MVHSASTSQIYELLKRVDVGSCRLINDSFIENLMIDKAWYGQPVSVWLASLTYESAARLLENQNDFQ